MPAHRLMITALAAVALACGGSKPDNADDAATSDTADAEEPREGDAEASAAAQAEAAAAEPVAAEQRDTISRRPVDIALSIGNSRTYAGNYRASGISRGCVRGGTAQLTVSGSNDLGETLKLTVVCKPNRS